MLMGTCGNEGDALRLISSDFSPFGHHDIGEITEATVPILSYQDATPSSSATLVRSLRLPAIILTLRPDLSERPLESLQPGLQITSTGIHSYPVTLAMEEIVIFSGLNLCLTSPWANCIILNDTWIRAWNKWVVYGRGGCQGWADRPTGTRSVH